MQKKKEKPRRQLSRVLAFYIVQEEKVSVHRVDVVKESAILIDFRECFPPGLQQ